MARHTFRLSDSQSQELQDLALSNETTPSDLLRQMVGRVLKSNVGPVTPRDPGKRGRKAKVQIRLSPSVFAEVDALALSEGRSVPSWVGALVESRVSHALPFNPTELDALQVAITELARVGRNLNTLLHVLHRSGRGDAGDVRVEELRETVGGVLTAVIDTRGRALQRYGIVDEG